MRNYERNLSCNLSRRIITIELISTNEVHTSLDHGVMLFRSRCVGHSHSQIYRSGLNYLGSIVLTKLLTELIDPILEDLNQIK